MEQAAHFIKPIVDKAVEGCDVEVKLVKLSKRPGDFIDYAKRLSLIKAWKDPDILLSIVTDSTECPLLVLEISRAVPTKDHEDQRYDGIVAALKNNTIYAKISSPDKVSPADHGGQTNFDPTTEYATAEQMFPESVANAFDVPVFLPTRTITQHKHESGIDYLQCPAEKDVQGNNHPYYENFSSFVMTILETALKSDFNPDDWVRIVKEQLLTLPWYTAWHDELVHAEIEDITERNNKRYYYDDDHLVVKINRFGHDMDPERGKLAYFSLIVDDNPQHQTTIARMWFSEDKETWFRQAGEGAIREYIENEELRIPYDFLFCFMHGAGLGRNRDFQQIVQEHENSTDSPIIINLDDFLASNFSNLSKRLRVVFSTTNRFVIQHVHYRQDAPTMPISGEDEPYRLEQCTDPNIVDNMHTKVIFEYEKISPEHNLFTSKQDVTPIEDLKLNEDDLTYTIANGILQEKFKAKVHAISYQGDQGERPLLSQSGSGREQTRRYVDTIAEISDQRFLQIENKDEFSESDIQDDIEKMRNYNVDGTTENQTFITFLDEIRQLEDYPSAPSSGEPQVLLAVGFFDSNGYTIDKLKNLTRIGDENSNEYSIDYAFVISRDMKSWEIVELNSQGDFPELKGVIDIPEHYIVKKNDR